MVTVWRFFLIPKMEHIINFIVRAHTITSKYVQHRNIECIFLLVLPKRNLIFKEINYTKRRSNSFRNEYLIIYVFSLSSYRRWHLCLMTVTSLKPSCHGRLSLLEDFYTTDATSGVGIAYPSRVISGIRVAHSSVCSVMFCRSFVVLFQLSIVLAVLRWLLTSLTLV